MKINIHGFKKKYILILLAIISITIGLSIIVMNKKKAETKVDPNKIEIERKLSTIDADVVLYRSSQGGECIYDYNYYICYDNLKIFEYEIFKYVPLADLKTYKELSSERYTLKEYDVSKEQMERLKSCINNNEMITESNVIVSVLSYYTLKIEGKNYKVEDSKTINDILKEIRNNSNL